MLDKFKNPPAQYRIAPLWFWNTTPDIDETERQVREMHAKGIGGFFIVDNNGVRDTSPAQWQQCLQQAKSTADRLGMFVDECVQSRSTEASCGIDNHTIDALYRQAQCGDQLSAIGGIVEIPSPDRPPVQALMVCSNWPDHSACSPAMPDKLAVSTAHCAGLHRVLATPFVSSGWGMSMEQMKAAIDRAAALGINVFCPYGFAYSMPFSPDTTSGASLFYQSSYWPYFRHLADYTARLCYALSQGKHRAQVALLNPVSGFSHEYGLDPDSPAARLGLDYFNVYCEFLLKEHIDYDIVCEASIAGALVLDQHLVIENEEYGLLIMPPTTAMSCEAARRIQEYVEDGGPLLANVLLPTFDADGDRHSEVSGVFGGMFGLDAHDLRSQVIEGKMHRRPRLSHNFGNLLFYEAADAGELVPGLRQTVSLAIKPEVSVRSSGVECRDIIYQHRVLEDCDLYFFHNTASEPRDVHVSVRCDKAPRVLDLQTGGTSALANCTLKGSRTVFAHRFDPYESLLIRFSNEIALPAAPRTTQDGLEIVLANQWKFRIEGHNCLVLDNWSADVEAESVATFEADHLPDELLLVLEKAAAGPSGAMFNGLPIGDPCKWVLDVSYDAFDITALIRPGVNEIRLSAVCGENPNGMSATKPIARLMGSFSLDRSGAVLCETKSNITTGSWTDQGYPFFSGTASYSQVVDIPTFHNNQRVLLRVEKPADVVEFIANGAVAGVRAWAPYEVDITHLVKPGPNSIELKITNAPANTITHDARPSGLLQGARLIIC